MSILSKFLEYMKKQKLKLEKEGVKFRQTDSIVNCNKM